MKTFPREWLRRAGGAACSWLAPSRRATQGRVPAGDSGPKGEIQSEVAVHGKLQPGEFRCHFPVAFYCLCALSLAGAGCRKEMWQQPKYKPLDMSEFYNDSMSARPLIEGTVAVGEFHTNESFYTGLVGTNLVTQFPLQITPDVLRRGQERYDIYCAVCHGPGGDGDGMIVQRGFPHPPSYHIERLRRAPIGHFYRVITKGYGVMYPYASRVPPEDRWKIAAYIRVLQLSRDAALEQAPAPARNELSESKP